MDPPVTLFMGEDKYESKQNMHEFKFCIWYLWNYIVFMSNILMKLPILILDEELIKWGWPEDVWFHVDKLSSAHVYLRLRPVYNILQ